MRPGRAAAGLWPGACLSSDDQWTAYAEHRTAIELRAGRRRTASGFAGRRRFSRRRTCDTIRNGAVRPARGRAEGKKRPAKRRPGPCDFTFARRQEFAGNGEQLHGIFGLRAESGGVLADRGSAAIAAHRAATGSQAWHLFVRSNSSARTTGAGASLRIAAVGRAAGGRQRGHAFNRYRECCGWRPSGKRERRRLCEVRDGEPGAPTAGAAASGRAWHGQPTCFRRTAGRAAKRRVEALDEHRPGCKRGLESWRVVKPGCTSRCGGFRNGHTGKCAAAE